ncbi:MAG: HD domain-containing phosphohydrolase [Armatimonadota bacterium]
MQGALKILETLSQLHPELSEQIEATARLLREQTVRAQHLESLLDISAQLNATLDYQRLLRTILQRSCELIDAEASSLFLVEPKTGDLVMALATTIPADVARTIRVPKGEGIVGKVVATGEMEIVADAVADSHFYNKVDAITHFTTRSIVCVPLRTHEISLDEENDHVLPCHIIGAAEVLNKRDGSFDAEDIRMFEALASQAAVALETSRLYASLRATFLGVVSALVESIDAKDDYTRGHSARVAEVSVALGRAMNLSREEIATLRLSAILHDVGKIGVPDRVLNKAGVLTAEEYEIIRQHPAIGYRILSKVPSMDEVLSGIQSHHERFDGRGYPSGRSGDEVSLYARIIGAADAFDAMTSDRVYRRALSLEEALTELHTGAGVQFDPAVVAAFEALCREGKITVPDRTANGGKPPPAPCSKTE